MIKEIIYDCHPIEEDISKTEGEGYYFSIRETIKLDKTEMKDEEDDERDYSMTDWYIHQDGTFKGYDAYYPYLAPSEHYYYEGTFDKSKYNDMVQNMKWFQSDWENELVYKKDINIEKEIIRSLGLL